MGRAREGIWAILLISYLSWISPGTSNGRANPEAQDQTRNRRQRGTRRLPWLPRMKELQKLAGSYGICTGEKRKREHPLYTQKKTPPIAHFATSQWEGLLNHRGCLERLDPRIQQDDKEGKRVFIAEPGESLKLLASDDVGPILALGPTPSPGSSPEKPGSPLSVIGICSTASRSD